MANPTPGETNLRTLFRTLTSTLHPTTFIFLTFAATTPPPATLPATMTLTEAEGTTIITTLAAAREHGLESRAVFPCRMVTLNVHSSLEAVGFIARIATRLTERGIGVNPVSGFFHDHLFVPVGREGEVMEVLEGLVREAREGEGCGSGEDAKEEEEEEANERDVMTGRGSN